jgi:hypothetical protein
MKRGPFAWALAGAALVAGVDAPTPAAPLPKHLIPKDEAVCFPTRVGDRLVSTLNGGELVVVVTKVVKVADGVEVTQEFENADGTRTHDMTVVASAAGLKVVRYSGKTLDEPFWYLKLPHAANNEWPAGPNPGLKNVTGGWEEVEVPAGKFRAVRVDRSDGSCFWYAPGLGCVKWTNGKTNTSRQLTAVKRAE